MSEAGITAALETLARFMERTAEDTRSASRDLARRIDRFEDVVGARFAQLDERLADICDYRKTEHSEFRRGIDEVNKRIDAGENQAKGRAQILGPAWGMLKDHAALAGCIALGAWTAADDIAPAVIAAFQPDAIAVVETFHEAQRGSVAAIPPEKLGALRGLLDDADHANGPLTGAQ